MTSTTADRCHIIVYRAERESIPLSSVRRAFSLSVRPVCASKLQALQFQFAIGTVCDYLAKWFQKAVNFRWLVKGIVRCIAQTEKENQGEEH